MKKYTKPELEIVDFAAEEVASFGNVPTSENDGGTNDEIPQV